MQLNIFFLYVYRLTEFNSNNTELLDIEQVKNKLLSLDYIREELKKSLQ